MASRHRPRGQLRNSARPCLQLAVFSMAMAGLTSMSSWRLATPLFAAHQPGATAPQELQRRSLVAAVLAAPLPAQAAPPQLKFFGEDKPKEYTVGGTFFVTMPGTYQILSETGEKSVWQGDRQGEMNRMFATARVVQEDTLDAALKYPGMALKDIGEELSNKRPLGAADFYGVEKLTKVKDAEAYRFEFVGDRVHEYVMHALVKKDSKNILCSIVMRAPGLLWSDGDRYIRFQKIIDTFKLA
eukprot:TRINITY_DN43766_c0_g1_i1.p1 TRINITY_DN43766_c0_g1~~TRINITY_DN43766_c0_g1_i1.p1  ORF type:complete len:261 (+),score=54.08 TRINITY_DN43766_c0_g1_i1:60-785(+)